MEILWQDVIYAAASVGYAAWRGYRYWRQHVSRKVPERLCNEFKDL